MAYIESSWNTRRIWMIMVFCGLWGLAFNFLYLIPYYSRSMFMSHVPPLLPNKYKNYFLDLDNLTEMGLLINTSSCQIPNFSAWDPAITPLLQKALPLTCSKANYSWSSLIGHELVMNINQMYKDGFSFQRDLHCCYRVITRVGQSLKDYDIDADNLIKLSSCRKIQFHNTRVKSELLQVECNRIDTQEMLYKGYHGSALTKDLTTDDRRVRKKGLKKPSTLSKVNHWKNKTKLNGTMSEKNLSPNILIIGQDSTSRLSFRRNMNSTRAYLEFLGAVEMLGYIKVGENTLPNLCQVLSGYSEENLRRLCLVTDNSSVDSCPLIFRRFDEAKYLTSFIEDSPFYTMFNYKQTGFVRQPVDFYVRPLFIGALGYGIDPNVSRMVDSQCIGSKPNDEGIISYLESTLDFAHRHSSPLFALTWSTALTHNNINSGQLSAAAYAQFLRRIQEKGYLNNTILFFMGDHGYRFGPLRQTLVGYFEDRLPNMWIRLPPKLKQKYPQWQKALEVNSARVTSPQVLYWTLQNLLETFTPVKKEVVDAKTPNGETIPRPRKKYTFFEEVPENTSCEDMSIPEDFCPCYPLKKVDVEESLPRKAAEHAVSFINSVILKNTTCEKLSVANVTAGTYNNTTKTGLNGHKELVYRYIVGFVTSPGFFLVEADINYFPGNSSFSENPNVQRANKINPSHIGCIDSKKELFCFCRV